VSQKENKTKYVFVISGGVSERVGVDHHYKFGSHALNLQSLWH